jgi:hypothetical protein
MPLTRGVACGCFGAATEVLHHGGYLKLLIRFRRRNRVVRRQASVIQEEILLLPKTINGRDPIKEADIRPIAKTLDWNKQRKMWWELKNSQAVNPALR